MPTGLFRILNRDLRLAGIPKCDERGRTLDVHALRTTFGTLLSKGGVAPRTAQAAMRHSDIRLTMQVYTDSKLLDVRGALDAPPALPLDQGDRRERLQATGTDAAAPAPFVPPFVLTQYKPSANLTPPDKTAGQIDDSERMVTIATSGNADKRKDPLTAPVSGSAEWAARDSNPRPHGCDPCALAS